MIYINKLGWVGYSGIRSSRGCELDPLKAFDYLLKSAVLGSARGMAKLGISYITGNGVARNATKGIEWVKKSADAGNLTSYSLLSKIYSDGGIDGHDDGCSRDYIQAYVIGRTLQEISQPNSQLSQWAREDIDKARPNITPENLLIAEDRIPEEVSRMKSVTHETFSEQPRTLKASQLTKDQWKSMVPQHANIIRLTGAILCQRQALFDALGLPDKTQTQGSEKFLYWQCSDGVVQVVCDQNYFNAGTVTGTVNDYLFVTGCTVTITAALVRRPD